jgi:hypothetical protein
MVRNAQDPPPDVALAGVPHRVVSLEELRALGLDARAVSHRVARGRLHRLHRGVYAVGHPSITREGWWRAAVLACGPGAVLSGLSDVLCEVGVTDTA